MTFVIPSYARKKKENKNLKRYAFDKIVDIILLRYKSIFGFTLLVLLLLLLLYILCCSDIFHNKSFSVAWCAHHTRWIKEIGGNVNKDSKVKSTPWFSTFPPKSHSCPAAHPHCSDSTFLFHINISMSQIYFWKQLS